MEGTRIYKNFHQWLLPPRAVVGILGLASVFVFVGIVLLAIGSPGLTVGGAIFFGIGLILVLICLLLCLHACFVLYVKDEGTQTQANDTTSSDNKRASDFIPTYAVIDKKPPPSPSSVRNGRIGGGAGTSKKFVTLGGNPPHSATVTYQDRGNSVPYQTSLTYPPAIEGGNLKYSTYNAGQPSYEYQQQPQQQYYQQQQRIARQLFPVNSSQPTPYSTLSSRQQQSSNYAVQVYPGFSSRYDEDYDNPGDSTPMLNQQQSPRWATNSSLADDIPEPTPLVHPSAKRPMTFDQVSSSKMSIYDNVQFGLNKLDEEE
ncbi:uncharacterized protein LOC133172505 isoform X2 [Saccostrea echinata]|uniref:uncharacterized protein LOC133172505 isoform X2 n=1 Tax=Saccostrea echinata TaxID=191078 RepID=UPI002A7FE160|nr:uncharacterized protein LOC133172505 isoform X2 [Saccostrea echinata]